MNWGEVIGRYRKLRNYALRNLPPPLYIKGDHGGTVVKVLC